MLTGTAVFDTPHCLQRPNPSNTTGHGHGQAIEPLLEAGAAILHAAESVSDAGRNGLKERNRRVSYALLRVTLTDIVV